MTKNILNITFLFSLLIGSSVFAQDSFLARHIAKNKNPKHGIFGVSFEGVLVNSRDGDIFIDSIPDSPHGEFGFGIGFDYWKKYLNHYDYHLGLDIKYNRYHFHKAFDPDLVEHDGYFNHLYLSIPFTLNIPLHNYPNLFIMLGTSLNSTNIFPIKRGTINQQNYDTRIRANWLIYPGFHFGLNFLEEKSKKAFFRGQIIYSFAPFRNLAYDANVYFNTFVDNSTGTVGTGRLELKFTVYPFWSKDIRNETRCK